MQSTEEFEVLVLPKLIPCIAVTLLSFIRKVGKTGEQSMMHSVYESWDFHVYLYSCCASTHMLA